ncbi:major facilitator superfamily domain-containing protein [Aspergillus cavernicola]|uniref:Major facilitator superfamily domain-containing protein n=1 Tax=Aspergillus cavernicola TaxID=176166 RepID=A0ABR4HSP1_9EURO
MEISEQKNNASIDIALDNGKELKTTKSQFLSQFTAEDDRQIMRKVDRRVLLLMGIMYLLKQIDFSNAASVKVLQVGLPSNILNELHMSTNDYNWTQTIYYIGLVIFEVPSNLVLKRVSPHKWMTRIFLSWGIVVACHAAIQNKAGFYALRFLLGALEAGFFPGLAAQMCSWYRSDEYGRPIMWMFAFQNCAGIIGSLLVYGISYMNGVGGLSAWRWIFLLEGLVTILFCPAIYFILPDYPKSPSSSKWLTPEEQEYLELRLSDNAPRAADPNFSLKEILNSLKDPKMYLFTASQFLLNIAGYGLSWQLPTITTSLGFASLPRNQLLNIPPAAATVIGIIIAARVMRWAIMTRPLFCQLLNGIALIFFIVLCVPVNPGATYAACVLGTAFYYVYFIPFWAWRSSSLVGATGTAFAIALQTALAQIGGIIAPQVFQSKYAANNYRVSFIICTACAAAAMVSNQILWYLSRDVEGDVLQVRRHRIAAERDGRVWTGEDVKLSSAR